jgi:hypothetical protein
MVRSSSITPVEYSCKILPFGNWASIAIATNISLGILFIGIFAKLPVWLLVLFIVGLMYYIVTLISCIATFRLSESTLQRTLENPGFLLKKHAFMSHRWSDVKGYKNGTDRGRYRGEYEYLEVKFKNGDEWVLNDMYGAKKDEFGSFLTCFLSQVEDYNQSLPTTAPATTYANTNPVADLTPIVRKKTIYESIWGKLFTVLLGIFILAAIGFGLPYMGATSFFKLGVVIIPGFLYMAYRVFIRKG